jgi:hypothetical protein
MLNLMVSAYLELAEIRAVERKPMHMVDWVKELEDFIIYRKTNTQTEVSQLYEIGNKKFFASTLNPDGSFGRKEYHIGLMEVSIEFSNETTDISADDEPAFVRLNSPLTGEGTVKFAVLPFSVYSKFFDVSTDKNGAVVINSRGKSKEIAFGFYTTLGDGSESMFTLYRAVFALPALSSVSFDGQTIRDLTLNVKVYPYSVKQIDRIITKSVSRFARNQVECMKLARDLKNKGITIFFETQGIDTKDESSFLILSILSSLAEEEIRTLSRNVTWGRRKRFKDGEVNWTGRMLTPNRNPIPNLPATLYFQ